MKWSWIIFAYVSLFSFGLLDNIRGPLYPEILKWFTIGTTQGSLLFSGASLSGLIICLVNKFWLRRFGALRCLRFFIILMTFSSLGMGLSGYFMQGFPYLIFFSCLFGISTGGSGICMNILVAQGSNDKWRRRALSGLHSMYGFASFLAPAFAGLWIQSGGKWCSALVLLALVPLITWLGSFATGRGEAKFETSADLPLPRSYHFLFGFIFAFCVAAELSLSTQIPLFGERVLGWSVEKSSFYLSLFFLFLLAGRFIFSLFHFPGKSHTWLLLSTGFGSISYFLGLNFHPFFLPFSGLFISIFFPCAVDWISTLFENKIDKLMASVMTMVGVFVVGMHIVVGRVTDQWGLKVALTMGPLCLLISFILLLFLRKKNWKY